MLTRDALATLDLHWLNAGAAPRWSTFTTGWRTMSSTFAETTPDGRWTVELEDGRRFECGPGDVFFVPAGVRHRLTVPGGVPRMISRWCFLGLEQLPGIDLFLGQEVPPPLRGVAAHEGAALLAELVDLTVRPASPAHTIAAKRAAYRLTELLLACVPGGAVPPPGGERIARTLRFVAEHYHEPIGRAELARVAGLSPTRFHAVFKEVLHVAPLQFVMRYRLQAAQRLLLSTRLGLKEIAEQSGFGSSFYLSRQFRRYLHQTPTAFRAAYHPGATRTEARR